MILSRLFRPSLTPNFQQKEYKHLVFTPMLFKVDFVYP
jgi:hypothetical protein